MNDKKPPNIVDGLWNEHITEKSYGPKFHEHLFEQYTLYVKMADKVSERRNLSNTFFLTLHTLLLSIIGFSLDKGPDIVDKWIIFFPLAAVLALCFSWWMIVRSYRQLNTGKFKVIGEFEKKLPSSPYWNAEWKALGEGKDIKKYLPLTHVENWVPVIFSILYIILALIIYYSPI